MIFLIHWEKILNKRLSVFAVQKIDIRDPSVKAVAKSCNALAVQLPDNSMQIVSIERQDCNYGGARYFLNCPKCRCKRYAIYASNGSLGCKRCSRLCHPIENLTKSNRAIYMANRMAREIEGKNIHAKTLKKIKGRERAYLILARESACERLSNALDIMAVFLYPPPYPP
jgi:hypothetical protein